MLEVVKYPVKKFKRRFDVFPGNIAAGLRRSMNKRLVTALKKCPDKKRLKKRLSTGQGYPS
jgi:hypothetical protein